MDAEEREALTYTHAINQHLSVLSQDLEAFADLVQNHSSLPAEIQPQIDVIIPRIQAQLATVSDISAPASHTHVQNIYLEAVGYLEESMQLFAKGFETQTNAPLTIAIEQYNNGRERLEDTADALHQAAEKYQ